MQVCTTIKTTLPLLAAASLCFVATAAKDGGKSDGGAKGATLSTAPNKGKTHGAAFRTNATDGGIAGASCGSILLTQNTDSDTITAFNSVACNDGIEHTDNRYARSFVVPGGGLNISCVDFAVEENGGGAQDVVVNLFIDSNGGAPDNASLVLLDSETVSIPAASGAAKYTANFAPAVNVAAGASLVVELFTPATPGNLIFIGSNAAGQSGPSYIQAADCGLGDYGDLAGIGFPTMHIIIDIGADPGNACLVPLPFCPQDIAPGGGDNVVGIADLLGVIGTFNQDGNPTGPRPLGDVTPLPNGDCRVLIGDLLSVIGAWGLCPIPTGRCCQPDGTCTVTTAAACVFPNIYGGDFSTCGTCTPFPLEDFCQFPVTLVDGINALNNTGATESPEPGLACSFGAAGIADDIWGSYTATCTGTLTLSLCGEPTLDDTLMEAYTGSCGSLVSVACNDDFCGPTGLQSNIVMPVTIGETYLVRLGAWGGAPAEGDLTLEITCAPPNDNNCTEPTDVGALPASVNGDLFEATSDTVPVCNGITPIGAGRWYTVVGTGNTMTASLCNSANIGWDSGLNVYCGDCSSLFCVAAEEGTASGCCGGLGSCGTSFHETVSWCSTLGQVYRILVWDTSAVPAGGLGETDYTLDVTDNGVGCGSAVECAACADAVSCQVYSAAIDNANTSDNVNFTTADNFHPTADGNITSICAEGVTISGAFPTGGFGVRYFEDDGTGTPGTLLASFSEAGATLTVNGIQGSGNIIAGIAQSYIAELSHAAVPVLDDTCYWVEVTNQASEAWFWVNSADGDGSFAQDPIAEGDGYEATDIFFGADLSFCLDIAFDAASPCGVPPPANDECDTAIDLGTGQIVAFPVNISGATDSGINVTCDKFGDTPGVNSDLWYRWEAPTTDTYEFSTCGGALDTKIAVYNDGPCPPAPLSDIGCNDDSANGTACAPPDGLASRTDVAVTAGNSYLVRVGTWSAGPTGPTVLNIRASVPPPPPPANDDCSTPIDITSNINGAPVGGDNTSATTAGSDPFVSCEFTGGSPQLVNTVWYTFTAPANGSVTISSIGSVGTMIDSTFAIYSNGCTATVEVGCGEDEGGGPSWMGTAVMTGLTPGATYHVCFGNSTWVGAFPGSYTFTITSP